MDNTVTHTFNLYLFAPDSSDRPRLKKFLNALAENIYDYIQEEHQPAFVSAEARAAKVARPPKKRKRSLEGADSVGIYIEVTIERGVNYRNRVAFDLEMIREAIQDELGQYENGWYPHLSAVYHGRLKPVTS